MVHDGVLEHVNVERDFKGARPHGRHLPKHHVLCNTVTIILLAHRRCLHEDFDRLLE
jgi:hypothetical protein